MWFCTSYRYLIIPLVVVVCILYMAAWYYHSFLGARAIIGLANEVPSNFDINVRNLHLLANLLHLIYFRETRKLRLESHSWPEGRD
jgi:hypothetical protein